jgi:hypothetical protein
VVTVMAGASESTIRECVEAGRHYGVEVAVDLLGVADPLAAAKRVAELGVSWLDVHCPIDAQMRGEDPLALLRKVRADTKLTLAVAGGINSESAASAVEAGADVVIVGGRSPRRSIPNGRRRTFGRRSTVGRPSRPNYSNGPARRTFGRFSPRFAPAIFRRFAPSTLPGRRSAAPDWRGDLRAGGDRPHRAGRLGQARRSHRRRQ